MAELVTLDMHAGRVRECAGLAGAANAKGQPTMKLLKYESTEPDNIDQVLMVVPMDYNCELAYEVAEGCLGPCTLVATAVLDIFHTYTTASMTDFDPYRPFTG